MNGSLREQDQNPLLAKEQTTSELATIAKTLSWKEQYLSWIHWITIVATMTPDAASPSARHLLRAIGARMHSYLISKGFMHLALPLSTGLKCWQKKIRNRQWEQKQCSVHWLKPLNGYSLGDGAGAVFTKDEEPLLCYYKMMDRNLSISRWKKRMKIKHFQTKTMDGRGVWISQQNCFSIQDTYKSWTLPTILISLSSKSSFSRTSG